MAEPRMDPLAWASMCIVNHLFDMAGVTVDVRQRINDEADAYVLMKLQEVVDCKVCAAHKRGARFNPCPDHAPSDASNTAGSE